MDYSLITRRRKEAGMSMDDLGKRIGVSRYTISKIEGGKMSPAVERLEDILDVLSLRLVIVPCKTECPFIGDASKH